MRTAVPEKILKIIDDIDTQGNASLTRLTVLKKWFEHRGRLPAFGLWVARRAAGRKGKTKGEHGALLDEARALLGPASTRESVFAQPDRRSAEDLHTRARAAQNEFKKQEWGPVRIVHCWPLLLVEEGLAIYLWHADSPSHGYKLAADWAQNYDSRYGNGLNGPSRGKLEELVRFMFTVEAIEEDEMAKRATPAEMEALSAPFGIVRRGGNCEWKSSGYELEMKRHFTRYKMAGCRSTSSNISIDYDSIETGVDAEMN